MNKPKLLFVYDHKKPEYWMDGLWAALNLLEQDFEITKLNLQFPTENETTNPLTGFDFILGWGAFSSPVDKFLKIIPQKKGLCIGGNAMSPEGANEYDVLFYETKWYRPQISFHQNIVHAFGINSDLYNQPDLPMPLVWDYIGVGSLSYWKRWEKMIDKKGKKLVVGEFQKQNHVESSRIANHLLVNGVMVSDMVHPFDLANYYHWSRTLLMPSDVNGGGERSILEARACGLQVEIEDDNPKLKELLTCPIYDEKYYYEQLKKGVMSVL